MNLSEILHDYGLEQVLMDNNKTELEALEFMVDNGFLWVEMYADED